MTKKSNYELTHTIRQNAYFFIPFALWVLIGGCPLLACSRSELFFAVNGAFNPFLDKLNTVLSAFGRGDVIPFILLSLLLIPAYRNLNYILTTLAFGVIIPLVIYVTKQFFNTPRPLKYYDELHVHTVPWLDNLYETSFPSGHTLGAFGFFMILSLYMPSSLKPISILFFLLAIACGYSRLYLGQHFFADVYAGSIVGTLLSVGLYMLGKRFIPNPKQV